MSASAKYGATYLEMPLYTLKKYGGDRDAVKDTFSNRITPSSLIYIIIMKWILTRYTACY